MDVLPEEVDIDAQGTEMTHFEERVLPDLAFHHILHFLSLHQLKILRLACKSLEERVTAYDDRLRHWHIPLMDFRNSAKYKKMCDELLHVKLHFPARYHQATIGLDMSAGPMPEDGGRDIILLLADRITNFMLRSDCAGYLKETTDQISLPILQSLQLKDFAEKDCDVLKFDLKGLKTLELMTCTFNPALFLRVCKGLKHLEVKGNCDKYIPQQIASSAASLQSLSVEIDPQVLQAESFQQCKALQTLKLEFFTPVRQSHLSKLNNILSCVASTLTKLELHSLSVATFPLNNLSKLKHLHVEFVATGKLHLTIPSLRVLLCKFDCDSQANVLTLDLSTRNLRELYVWCDPERTGKLVGLDKSLPNFADSLKVLDVRTLSLQLESPLPKIKQLKSFVAFDILMRPDLWQPSFCADVLSTLKLDRICTENFNHAFSNLRAIKKLDLEVNTHNVVQISSILAKCSESKLSDLTIKSLGVQKHLYIDNLSSFISHNAATLTDLSVDNIFLNVDEFPDKFDRLRELSLKDTNLCEAGLASVIAKCAPTLLDLNLRVTDVKLSDVFTTELPRVRFLVVTGANIGCKTLQSLFQHCFLSLEVLILDLAHLDEGCALEPLTVCPRNLNILDLEPEIYSALRKVCQNKELRQVLEKRDDIYDTD